VHRGQLVPHQHIADAPDVIGTYKPLASKLIKFPIEIVAERSK